MQLWQGALEEGQEGLVNATLHALLWERREHAARSSPFPAPPSEIRCARTTESVFTAALRPPPASPSRCNLLVLLFLSCLFRPQSSRL